MTAIKSIKLRSLRSTPCTRQSGPSTFVCNRESIGTVISNTNVTERPNHNAVFTFFETARNEHIPRKNANIILSTKIDLKNKLKKCSIIFRLYKSKHDVSILHNL